jgi:ATP-dependent Clp protease protease subunit
MRNTAETPSDAVPQRGASSLVSGQLFAARTVLVFGEITMALAESVASQLFALAALSKEAIRVVINSPGGHVESGDTLYDVIRFIEPEVKIIGSGWVASAGALIFAAAERHNRIALPNTRFLLHQPMGGVGGPASDIEIEARQIMAVRERLNRIFARATDQAYEKIARDTERNHWMDAKEAKAYGLVGRIVERAADLAGDASSAR